MTLACNHSVLPPAYDLSWGASFRVDIAYCQDITCIWYMMLYQKDSVCLCGIAGARNIIIDFREEEEEVRSEGEGEF